MPGSTRRIGAVDQLARLLGDARAGAGGRRRPTAAAPASRARDRGRAARAGRWSASATAKRAHERARAALPPTSANAWRTRSRAPGAPREESRSPRSGRKTSRALWESTRSRPGTRAGAGGDPPAAAQLLVRGAAVQPVRQQDQPRRRDLPARHRVQHDLGAEAVAADHRRAARAPRGRSRRTRRRTSPACRGGAGAPRSRRAAAGRAARRGSGRRAPRRSARTPCARASPSAAAPAAGRFPPRGRRRARRRGGGRAVASRRAIVRCRGGPARGSGQRRAAARARTGRLARAIAACSRRRWRRRRVGAAASVGAVRAAAAAALERARDLQAVLELEAGVAGDRQVVLAAGPGCAQPGRDRRAPRRDAWRWDAVRAGSNWFRIGSPWVAFDSRLHSPLWSTPLLRPSQKRTRGRVPRRPSPCSMTARRARCEPAAASWRPGQAPRRDGGRAGPHLESPVASFSRPVDPHQRSFPALELEVLERWRERDVFAESLRRRDGRAALGLLRGPADGQRPAGRPTTCSRACSRTSTRATRRCAATASSARAAGTATACRSRSRSSSSSASPTRRRSRSTGSRSSTAAAASRCSSTSRSGIALTERIGFWLDLDDAYRTLDPTYIESVWWALEQIHEQGPALREPPRRPLLPALRHGALLARGLAGYQDVVDASAYVKLRAARRARSRC